MSQGSTHFPAGTIFCLMTTSTPSPFWSTAITRFETGVGASNIPTPILAWSAMTFLISARYWVSTIQS